MVTVVYIQDYGFDKVGRIKTLPTSIANHVIKLGICEALIDDLDNEVKEVKTNKKKRNEKVS